MSKEKLIVISLDAFGTADLEYALTRPNFKAFREKAALVEKVETVYPSLTYMCHTSIVTGQYPNEHGIINNTKIQPNRLSPDWYWYSKDIKTPTVFDIANQNGYSVSTILWPVTGRSKSIKYNITEIFSNRKWQTQTLISLYASSIKYLAEKNSKFGHLRNGISQPELDDFVTAVAVDTIKVEKPDVMAVHLVDLDSTRHSFGVTSKEAKAAIDRMDKHLGEIFAALSAESSYENAHVVLLGDHYQIDTEAVVRPNHLFEQAGLLSADKKRQITHYQVYAKGADGSAYIYQQDQTLTYEALVDLLSPLDKYIERIYSHEEAVAMGADANCFAIVEAKHGYYFESDIVRPIVESTQKDIPGVKLMRGSHGYSPDKDNYTTMMMVSGPKINEQVVVEQASLVDEGPTFLALLNLSFPNETSGQVITEIFK